MIREPVKDKIIVSLLNNASIQIVINAGGLNGCYDSTLFVRLIKNAPKMTKHRKGISKNPTPNVLINHNRIQKQTQ